MGPASERSFPCGVWRGKQNVMRCGLRPPRRDQNGVSDWTLILGAWGRDQPRKRQPTLPIHRLPTSGCAGTWVPTPLICPQIDGPGSLHLAHSSKVAFTPESSVKPVTTGPSQLRASSSGVGSSPVFSVSTCTPDFHSLTITLSTLSMLAVQSRHNLCNLCSAWLGTPSFLAKFLRCIYLD